VSDDIDLISDGDGVAIVGPLEAVNRFLAGEGLSSRDLGLGRVKPSLIASGALETGAKIAENSGRWVKLTKESAAATNKYGVMKGTGKGLSRGVLTENGKIKGLIQFSRGGVETLTNPAMLAGAAGLVSQIAMQQQMDEIIDYLEEIVAKVDDVLRAQKDAVLADMVGVDLVIDDAMTVRGEVGRVSEITWSKVHATSTTIARTQV
jgi:predicted P-loop ATPase